MTSQFEQQCRRVLVVGMMVSAVAAFAGADSASSGYRQPKDEIGQLDGSVPWDRIVQPYDHPLSLYPDEFEEVVGPFRRRDRDITVRFRPLCETVISHKPFNRTASGHEFRPPFYQEVLCKSNDFHEGQIPPSLQKSQMCFYPGYSCIQRKREMFVTRRRFGASCWEPVTVAVPSNCECMWPLGDSKGDLE